jgi:SAM-dependent methyltransferase
VHDAVELRARILGVEGTPERGTPERDTPERREIFERWFAGGAPRKLVRAAQRFDLSSARALDVGCGHGVYLAQFSSASVGIDRCAECVAFARSMGLHAEVRDVETPGWSDGLGVFELVWLCDILVHVREPRALLGSLHGLLSPTGRLVITEWLWPRSPMLAALIGACIPGGREVLTHPDHLHRFDRDGLARILGDAGFEIEAHYNHSFASPFVAALTDSFWPPRTIVARSAMRR